MVRCGMCIRQIGLLHTAMTMNNSKQGLSQGAQLADLVILQMFGFRKHLHGLKLSNIPHYDPCPSHYLFQNGITEIAYPQNIGVSH